MKVLDILDDGYLMFFFIFVVLIFVYFDNV